MHSKYFMVHLKISAFDQSQKKLEEMQTKFFKKQTELLRSLEDSFKEYIKKSFKENLAIVKQANIVQTSKITNDKPPLR